MEAHKTDSLIEPVTVNTDVMGTKLSFRDQLATELAKISADRQQLVAAQLIGICQGVQIAAKLEQAS